MDGSGDGKHAQQQVINLSQDRGPLGKKRGKRDESELEKEMKIKRQFLLLIVVSDSIPDSTKHLNCIF